MFSIKLYQQIDWVRAYLRTWGYEDEALAERVYHKFLNQQHNLSVQEISRLLDDYLITYLSDKMTQNALSDTQKLNYFKMIFLKEKCFEECSIFEEITPENEDYLRMVFQTNAYHVAPDMFPSDMFPQSIKTYHPVNKVKKVFVKGLNRLLSKGLKIKKSV